MNPKKVMQAVDLHYDRYIDFLCGICAFEARAYDKLVIDQMADYISEFCEQEGFSVTRFPFEKCGDFLTVDLNPGAEKSCLLLAHMDTVHEKGVFGDPPVSRQGDLIRAPGVNDCKGGIAVALLMMRALRDVGFEKHVRLLLTSDEEVSNILGGEEEQRFLRDRSAGFACALNCEVSENDQVVVSRKGILRYRIDITGVPGHSGKHYFDCKNPIVEAAHKILALEAKSQKKRTTFSCNVINGGDVANIIPKTCSFTVDIRIPDRPGMESAAQAVQEITETSFLPGTSAVYTLLSSRPPMEKSNATLALFHQMRELSLQCGLGDLIPIESGAGSDSCYTQMAGIASICGLGPCGGGCHTTEEFVIASSVAKRAKILAVFALHI